MADGWPALPSSALLLPALLALALPLLLLLLLRRPSKPSAGKAAGKGSAAAEGGKAAPGPFEAPGAYADPLRWAFLPNGRAHLANVQRTETFDSELCTLKVLTMHRPTHEPWREKSGDYPFSWHLEGRKRLWEIRLQLRFKELPKTKLYFGLTLGGFVPVSGLARQLQKTLVRACRGIVGDLYHSPGDDPAKTQGEVEPPTFVMPLWAFDQFVVSEPGDEPHLWGSLEGLGFRRTDGIAGYVRAMRSTVDSLSTEKVYTFAFWGVSQFLDCMNWQVCGGAVPGVRVDFNRLCGAAPVYVGMYEMPGVSESDADKRHLPSRKRHYFHVAMWSELRPPAPAVLDKILGGRSVSKEKAVAKPVKGWRALLGCCTARPGTSELPAKAAAVAADSGDETALGG